MIPKRQQTCLFLYGSLLTATPNRGLNKRVRRQLRCARPATIQARLYNLGRYPGVVTSALATDQVHGKVIMLNDPGLLRQLDRYEDYFSDNPKASEFVRILVQARLMPSRKYIDCWVYIYNKDIGGAQRIFSGDYLQHKRSQQKRR